MQIDDVKGIEVKGYELSKIKDELFNSRVIKGLGELND